MVGWDKLGDVESGRKGPKMLPYQNDFRYFYFVGEELVAAPLKDVPMDVQDYWTISEAVRQLAHAGCCGMSFNKFDARPSIRLAAAVVKVAIEEYGEMFPVLYRGLRDGSETSDRVVKYAATSRPVAEFYGRVVQLENVKGLRTRSMADSVVGDPSGDEEVIYCE